MKIGGLTLFERDMKNIFNGIYVTLFHWHPARSRWWRYSASACIVWYWPKRFFRPYCWADDLQAHRTIGIGPVELHFGVHKIMPAS